MASQSTRFEAEMTGGSRVKRATTSSISLVQQLRFRLVYERPAARQRVGLYHLKLLPGGRWIFAYSTSPQSEDAELLCWDLEDLAAVGLTTRAYDLNPIARIIALDSTHTSDRIVGASEPQFDPVDKAVNTLLFYNIGGLELSAHDLELIRNCGSRLNLGSLRSYSSLGMREGFPHFAAERPTERGVCTFSLPVWMAILFA